MQTGQGAAAATALMYSTAWFETFAASVPPAVTAAEVEGIAACAPPAAFPRLLELGCGTGRVAGPLAERGYTVTGIDINTAALAVARRAAPNGRYVALDQRHVGSMPWSFDVVVVLWNSFGFGTRDDDRATLAGIHRVLRRAGRLLLDMYQPAWLRRHPLDGQADSRGAVVHRRVTDGRCFHVIHYPDGTADDIQFNVYEPAEIAGVALDAGFHLERSMVWWDPSRSPGDDVARYQLVLVS